MSDTPVIRRAQFRGVTLSRDDLVAEARKYMDEHPGWPELGDTSDIMADFAMMIAARVALRMTLPAAATKESDCRPLPYQDSGLGCSR